MEVDPQILQKFDRPVPRYTSYPTAPKFSSIEESVYLEKISALALKDDPISIYIHIPFCKSMCLFCGCSVILNRSEKKQADYVSLLIQEIHLFGSKLKGKKKCSQLHFGGGTPTSLVEGEFDRIMEALGYFFIFTGEVAIEIDPRTVALDEGKKLSHLKKIGFNRVSFGVQDLDETVQEAVKRRQSKDVSHQTLLKAKELGFLGINLDLIYGLPFQTVETFQKTALAIAAWKPDRIALFSYAKVPHLKPHQKAISEKHLPSVHEKFQIYVHARRIFMDAGYVPIGMDHFALPEDLLTQAFKEKKLGRNFQGYTVDAADDLIPFGVTSIGCVGGSYFQNVKTLEEYAARLGAFKLPIFRGVIVTKEDALRRYVIQSLMCQFLVDKLKFFQLFGKNFDEHFREEKKQFEKELVEDGDEFLKATELGKLLIRRAASIFDQYLATEGSRLI